MITTLIFSPINIESMSSIVDSNLLLPLSWKQIFWSSPLNFSVEPYKNVMLLQNPSNHNEILIFDRCHLEKTHGYNVRTGVHTTRMLLMWPTILFKQYNHLRQPSPLLPVDYVTRYNINYRCIHTSILI